VASLRVRLLWQPWRERRGVGVVPLVRVVVLPSPPERRDGWKISASAGRDPLESGKRGVLRLLDVPRVRPCSDGTGVEGWGCVEVWVRERGV